MEVLMMNLANKLAALELAKAEAPTASPTWRGQDAVEAATREVVAAAHAMVVGHTAKPSINRVVVDTEAVQMRYTPFLRLGLHVINRETVSYFEETPEGLFVHYRGEDELVFHGEEADILRAWLDLNSETLTLQRLESDWWQERE